MAELSCILVNWNTRDLLERCLAALRIALRGLDAEVIVIDNGSEDGSPDLIAEDDSEVVLVRNPSNRGYATAVNQGFDRATGTSLLLLGSDTAVHETAVQNLLRKLESLGPEYAAVAPQLLNEDGSIQPSCRALPSPGVIFRDLLGVRKLLPRNGFWGRYRLADWNHDDERDVDQPQMSCLLVRREALEIVGPLDDEAFPIYFNDVDWCARAQSHGLKIRFDPSARVIHGYGQTTRKLGPRRRHIWREGFLRYYDRWYGGWLYLPARLILGWITRIWAARGD